MNAFEQIRCPVVKDNDEIERTDACLARSLIAALALPIEHRWKEAENLAVSGRIPSREVTISVAFQTEGSSRTLLGFLILMCQRQITAERDKWVIPKANLDFFVCKLCLGCTDRRAAPVALKGSAHRFRVT